ncbi:MAG: TRAP transporter large permease subunit, partial [Geminicoccaceae bacterium]
MTVVLVAVFALALIVGIPISIAMGGAGMAALLWGGSFSPMLVPQRLFSGIDSFPLMAVPFFILAAELMTG